jgi:hypothetical protein
MGYVAARGDVWQPQTGGVQNLRQVQYLLANGNPLTRLFLNQLPQIARFDTGEPILGKGGPTTYPTDTSPLARGLNLFGLPINEYRPPKNAAKNARTLTRAQQRYAQLQQQYAGQTNIPGLP